MIKTVRYLDKDNICYQKQPSNMKVREEYAVLTTGKI